MKWRLDAGQIEVLDDAMADVLRRKSPGERMRLVGQAWRTARLWITAAVRSQHADWTEEQIQGEARRRLSGGTV